MTDETPATMNHNLAILAIVLAVAGIMFAGLGPWFVFPSLISAWFAWQGINKNPQRYTGKLFVYAALAVNLLLLVLYLSLYFG
ncbi:hypothetical protein [Marinospirillum insulare]|uniref:DUF4190 domain-containing protein n=1 Tax=Marinospirillum insulare TaxID=217169 RepID=A0ABQ5ZZ42_9GAMM|nr:hypothetical protein [Marinospirillum insulare]GLR64766.1 hypothetical protein GCM10007878_22040 [Marinospirillum insulare]